VEERSFQQVGGSLDLGIRNATATHYTWFIASDDLTIWTRVQIGLALLASPFTIMLCGRSPRVKLEYRNGQEKVRTGEA